MGHLIHHRSKTHHLGSRGWGGGKAFFREPKNGPFACIFALKGLFGGHFEHFISSTPRSDLRSWWGHAGGGGQVDRAPFWSKSWKCAKKIHSVWHVPEWNKRKLTKVKKMKKIKKIASMAFFKNVFKNAERKFQNLHPELSKIHLANESYKWKWKFEILKPPTPFRQMLRRMHGFRSIYEIVCLPFHCFTNFAVCYWEKKSGNLKYGVTCTVCCAHGGNAHSTSSQGESVVICTTCTLWWWYNQDVMCRVTNKLLMAYASSILLALFCNFYFFFFRTVCVRAQWLTLLRF